jgi:hypothetical protein
MLLLNPFIKDSGLAAVVSQLILSFLMRSGFSTLTWSDRVEVTRDRVGVIGWRWIKWRCWSDWVEVDRMEVLM